jgi:hypothetical protein
MGQKNISYLQIDKNYDPKKCCIVSLYVKHCIKQFPKKCNFQIV